MRQPFLLHPLALAAATFATLAVSTLPAVAGPGYFDATLTDGSRTRLPTWFANSPAGPRATPVPEAAALGLGSDTGAALRKFVDPLPRVGAAQARALAGDPAVTKYLPEAVPGKWVDPQGVVTADDYLELAVVEYTEKLHSDLARATTLRGYVQIDPLASNGRGRLPGSRAVPLTLPDGSPILIQGTDANGRPNGTRVPALAVDAPHHLGPLIRATQGTPLRVKFLNLLPTGRAELAAEPDAFGRPVVAARHGDLFLPVDGSILGAGVGPDGITAYTQNRANLHLHGGDNPWISDGTPHQWITPLDEADPAHPRSLAAAFATDPGLDPTLLPGFLRGASAANVPDMFDPGAGAATYYFPNGQSARMLWVHDQSVGQTRLNAYAGMAAPYLLTDAVEQAMVAAGTLPPPERTLPLILQDRTFVPADVALQDAKWNTSAWGEPGDSWFPHVYESFQDPEQLNNVNPAGRWYYGPQFFPIFPAMYALPSGEYGDATIVPEAFLDTPLVNGVAYPTLEVEPTTYRLRILNAAVDRFMTFNLFEGKATATLADGRSVTSPLGATEVDMVPATVPLASQACPAGQGRPTPLANSTSYCTPETWPSDSRVGGVPDPKGVGPTLYQIANEGGWLPAVAPLEPTPLFYITDKGRITVLNPDTPALFLAPAERADVVVDFSQYAGKTLIVYNDAGAPEPGADPRNAYFTGVGDQSYAGGAEDTRPGYGPNIRTMMQIRVKATNANGAAPQAFDPAPLQAAVTAAFKASQDRPLVAQPDYAAIEPTWSTLSPTQAYASIYTGTLKEPVFQFTPGTPSDAFNSIAVTAAGSGYTTTPAVTITPSNGVGSGATARATLKIDRLSVVAKGQGYVTAPTVTIVAQAGGGSGAAGTAYLAPDVVRVTAGGSGYTSPPTVNFTTQPGATKPVATAQIDAAGQVVGVTVTSPGKGYNAVPTVTFSGGGGTGAKATITASIDEVRLVSPYPITPNAIGGGGYTDMGQVLITLTGGSGSGALIRASGNVFDVAITNPGSGYTAPPSVTIGAPPAGGTPATAAVDRANGGLAKGRLPVQAKAIQELFDPLFGRYNNTLGVELPFTGAFNQTTIPLGYLDEPTEQIELGETQLWKVTHNGLFSQAMHFRLFNVQLINRVGWDGFVVPPQPNELGWKETVRINPLEDAIVALKPRKPALPGFGLPTSVRPMDPTQPLGSPAGFTQIDPATNNPKSVVNDVVDYGWEYSWQNGVQSRNENDFMRPVVFLANEAVPLAPTLDLAQFQGAGAVLQFTDRSSTEYRFSVRRADVDPISGAVISAFAEVGSALANGRGFDDDSVLPNQAYAYKVAAIGAAGEAESNELLLDTTTTPPAAPSAFTATALSDSQVALQWVDGSNNEAGFLLEHSLDGGATWTPVGTVRTIRNTVQVYTVPANGSQASDAGFSADTHVDYRLSAVNLIGQSAYATASVDTLAAPALASLSATAVSDRAVTLSWSLPANLKPNQTVSAYSVTRSGGAGPVSFTVAAPASGYADNALLQNTTYTYTVAAVNASGATPVVGPASTASATTPFTQPGAITGLTATANAATQVTLNWGGGAAAQSFSITRTGGAGGPVSVTLAAPAGQYVDTTVLASTAYTYTVIAVNGNRSTASAPVSVTTPTSVNAPTLVTATASATGIALAWTDRSTQETRFAIERSVNGGPFVQIAVQTTGNRTGTGGNNTFTNSRTAPAGFTVAVGNTYAYRIVAQVVAGTAVTAQSLPSAALSVVYAAPAAPVAPTVIRVQRNRLLLVPTATDRVDLSWTAPTLGSGQPAVSGYTVEWSTSATFTTLAGSTATNATATTASVTVNRGNAAAPNPATLYFRVRATNVLGTGAPSSGVGPIQLL